MERKSWHFWKEEVDSCQQMPGSLEEKLIVISKCQAAWEKMLIVVSKCQAVWKKSCMMGKGPAGITFIVAERSLNCHAVRYWKQ